MNEITENDARVERATVGQPDSTDGDYVNWKRRKVADSLKEMDQFEDQLLTEEDVWRKFGLKD